jgi:hypothetical protein
LRYAKLSDAQVLARLVQVCEAEHAKYSSEGLDAIVFTAQGDMRQVNIDVSNCNYHPHLGTQQFAIDSQRFRIYQSGKCVQSE